MVKTTINNGKKGLPRGRNANSFWQVWWQFKEY